MIFLSLVFCGQNVSAASNPNYGTTSFFSGSGERPVLEKPILDSSNNGKGKKKDNKSSDEKPDGSLFGGIDTGISSAISGTISFFSEAKKSLFDFQGDSGGSDFFDDGSEKTLIAGPRGEALEQGGQASSDSFSPIEFDFENPALKTAPKKSKLLLTGKEIDIDLTSQYIIISLIFSIALGAAVGYYYWSKATSKEKKYD